MSYFNRKLNTQLTSAFDLLLQLDGLTGLTYLYDQNNPIIAFSPKAFLIIERSTLQQFDRIEFDQYQKSTTTSILEFTNLDPTSPPKANNVSFQGGYIGFFSYDYAAQLNINNTIRSQPCFFLGKYQTFLKFQNNAWYFHSDEDEAQYIYDQICHRLEQPKKNVKLNLVSKCHPRWSKQQYMDAFDEVQEYIKAGDCYQINLTQEFKAKVEGSLLSQAQALWDLTHAPYAGYLNISNFELLSCSPELFIEFQAERKIKTRPIKGTMPRFNDPEQDQISKNKLSQSEKDQAENVMIVDLLRNDLSVYAEIGSVETTKLFEIESFNQVHHMVSEITATLKEEINPMQMLLSALPGGSITGAPKIRAMQIIEELEGAPRGAYCGSLGYFNFDGTGRWNILIRSIQKYQNELSMWAGGGITIASDAEAEYQECFDKISAMIDLLNTWQQSEK
ncbi:aminodeoxychorismate synthase component I [Acinetobacter haemolyticus]|uniref:aminodeoxychorismate synthase component I n=1 Tax=Acinetobacter TaxID=469 RepID=UPI000C2C6A1D|nr:MULTISPECIES: aminodeoxychorismate synthase component I [Acinetobacter]ATZ66524.1 aminodeoxychorismate synthase, component I [Acinetobacter haemolyticus]NAR29713.1 aminodeoxychorismate synthase component I [Acinetobacter haemolyticus]NAR36412.1 aminodeoxychorismate synthase component I [Acinetobacter haemolyticus]NAR48884.1 aminodeoxychorismate synthase component I [Acinetobacter haemolyticus]